MNRARIIQADQVAEYRALGEMLQLRISQMRECLPSVPPDKVPRYYDVLNRNQTVFDNVARATVATVAFNQFLEKMLGISVEGCVVAMGGAEPTIKTGLRAAMALTNASIERAIAQADVMLQWINSDKGVCDEN